MPLMHWQLIQWERERERVRERERDLTTKCRAGALRIERFVSDLRAGTTNCGESQLYKGPALWRRCICTSALYKYIHIND